MALICVVRVGSGRDAAVWPLDWELGRGPLAGTTTGHGRQILKVDLGIPSGGITLGTRPHDSALGPVAGLAPPSVRVNGSS